MVAKRDGFLVGVLGEKRGELPTTVVGTLRLAEVLDDFGGAKGDTKSLKVKKGNCQIIHVL
jgi:hypothetical protein